MINIFHLLMLLVLLGLGVAIYFMTRETPNEEYDPFENIEPEPN